MTELRPEHADYFARPRHDIVDALVPLKPRHVLDVGCGSGVTGALLKQRWACRITGIELTQAAAAQARQRLDRVYAGNVEQMVLEFAPGEFDVLVLADVLEHLVDPWQMLARMIAWVQTGGTVISTIPNVRNFRVIRDLLVSGRFEYAAEGIMDRTHLRFFTRHSVRTLFEGAGLQVVSLDAVLPARSGRLNRLILGGATDLLAQKFFVKAIRPAADAVTPTRHTGAGARS